MRIYRLRQDYWRLVRQRVAYIPELYLHGLASGDFELAPTLPRHQPVAAES